MLTRLLLLPSVLILFTLHALAQAYEPGLLVRSEGDTLRGEIENGFWNEPPTLIRFRPTPSSPAQMFKPNQLKAFSFTGGRHFRYEYLPIDQAAETQLKWLPRGNSSNIRTEALLAEVLVEGPCSLLRVATAGAVHYVVVGAGRGPLDLSDRKYLATNESGVTFVADGNNYRSQLALHFLDCPAALKVAETAAFTPEALAKVVLAYNQECDAARTPGRNWLAQVKPQRKVSLLGGILLGARYNNIRNLPRGSAAKCADCQVRPFGGFYADLLLPNRTTAVYGELSLSRFRNRVEQAMSFLPSGAYEYSGLLGTARIGVRRFLTLPHEQQLLLGMGLEWNAVWRPTAVITPGPAVTIPETAMTFPSPTLLPNLAVGWRRRRLTITLDGQLYEPTGTYKRGVLGSGAAIRLGTAYQLGHNHDASAR